MGSMMSSLFGGDASLDSDTTLASSGITHFHDMNRWKLHFNSLKDSNQLLVVDFYAIWCGPCKFMDAILHAMAGKFTDVSFCKIEVDELSDVAKEFQVQAMPTFVLLKQGKEVDRVVGANKDELKQKIEKHRSV